MGELVNVFPEVKPLANAMIEHLFYEKALLVNQENPNLQKSISLSKLKGRVVHFVLSKPNSNFLLIAITVDGEVEVGLRFGNYEELTDRTGEYIITIHPNWSTFKVDQLLSRGHVREYLKYEKRHV